MSLRQRHNEKMQTPTLLGQTASLSAVWLTMHAFRSNVMAHVTWGRASLFYEEKRSSHMS